MYWYKAVSKYTNYIGVLLLLSSSYACNKPEIKETGAELKYFDLKGYFDAETTHLSKLNPAVNKTVSHNGTSETKQIHISNWVKELDLFTGSDINKPAWKLSYDVKANNDSIVYLAKYPELKTRKIVIAKESGKITRIAILNSSSNILYKTSEKLIYAPGKSYIIEKNQHVKVMGTNNYLIKGNFN